jgi:organic hydroperoxide reductase OsmC/OhrA
MAHSMQRLDDEVGSLLPQEGSMRDFPHYYTVSAAATPVGDVWLSGEQLTGLASAPPAEFDGPGDRWSPETLLVGAVADCFLLTFRAIAKISKLPWVSLVCEATGTLDRVDRAPQFTAFVVRASLTVSAGADLEQARRLMARSEHTCLVSNSLKASCRFEADVRVVETSTANVA